MKNSILPCFLFLSFLFSSCDKEEVAPVSEINISSIILEESYRVGETAEINLTIIKPTPCHIIEEETIDVSGKTHSYNFRLVDKAQVCIQVLAIDETVSVDFEPTEAGEHTLDFFINGELFETRTVIVTE